MATKRSRFYCDLCDKGYEFCSKYDRHLASSTHLNLEGTIKLQRNVENINPSVLPITLTVTPIHDKACGAIPEVPTESEDDTILDMREDEFSRETLEEDVCEDGSSSDLGMYIAILSVCESLIFCGCYVYETDINELLSGCVECEDYSPFSSKFHALAYMLVHSPRPMVKCIACTGVT